MSIWFYKARNNFQIQSSKYTKFREEKKESLCFRYILHEKAIGYKNIWKFLFLTEASNFLTILKISDAGIEEFRVSGIFVIPKRVGLSVQSGKLKAAFSIYKVVNSSSQADKANP